MDRVLQFEGLRGAWAYRVLGTRCPKRGEFYVSGAVPQAYKAPNDLASRYMIVEPVTEHTLRQVWMPCRGDPSTMSRLAALADWHEMEAKHPIDVSGSDSIRAGRIRFHAAAAADIRAAIQERPQ